MKTPSATFLLISGSFFSGKNQSGVNSVAPLFLPSIPPNFSAIIYANKTRILCQIMSQMRRVQGSNLLELALIGFQDQRITVLPTLQFVYFTIWLASAVKIHLLET